MISFLYASTCFEHCYAHHKVKIILYNFDLMMSTWCSKHVEAYYKLIIKQDFVHEVG